MAPLRSGPSESWRPAPRCYIYPRSALPAIGSAGRGVGPRSLAPSCRRALRPIARSPGSRLPPPPLDRPRRPSSPPSGRALSQPRWTLRSGAQRPPSIEAPSTLARDALDGSPGPRPSGETRRKQLSGTRTQAALAPAGRHLCRNSGAQSGSRRPQAKGSWTRRGTRRGHRQGRAFASPPWSARSLE